MNKLVTILVCIAMLSFKSNDNNTVNIVTQKEYNTIHFEKTAYGLIFTTIAVNGKKVKAMIDFGDPNMIQLSSSFVTDQKIPVKKANAIAKDVFGNTFDINKGTVKEVVIGNWTNNDIEFSSSPGEMESVSQQINTKFDAVIGWGYFSKYYSQIDYAASKFLLSERKIFDDKISFETTYAKNSNYLNVPVTINDAKANLIIDTGSPISLIDSSYYHQRKFTDIEVKLGAKQVPLDLQTQNLEVLKQLNANGIIGGDFLAKYKINIDPFTKKLEFIQKTTYTQN